MYYVDVNKRGQTSETGDYNTLRNEVFSFNSIPVTISSIHTRFSTFTPVGDTRIHTAHTRTHIQNLIFSRNLW